MAVEIIGKLGIPTATPVAKPVVDSTKKKSGHTVAKVPAISLDQPGRLRVANLMSLLGVGHSTLYEGLRRKRYPQPDGFDGKIPYWNTATIRQFLQA